jgi:glycosyltransferase involved in cell wall biosynthesis
LTLIGVGRNCVLMSSRTGVVPWDALSLDGATPSRASTKAGESPLRIVLIDPSASTPPYDANLAAALAGCGHDVELVESPSRFDSSTPAPFRRREIFFPVSGRVFRHAPRGRLRLALKAFEYAPSVLRLLRLLASERPDVVHLQWSPLPRYDVHWIRAIVSRWPTVITTHNVLPRRPRDVRAWLEILRMVDGIVVHSRRGVGQLARLGVDGNRVALIYHPVFEPPRGFVPTPPRGDTLLFFGLLRTYKGLDVLIRALALVVKRVPARLVVAGDPVDSVQPLRSLAASLGVADRIEWRLGFRHDAEVAELMEAARVVVLPYRHAEGSSVLATALGFRRPVVTSDVGSLGEIVREFKVGRAVPAGDVEALASALVEFLADAAVTANAYAATHAVGQKLRWDAAAGAHEQLYRTALASRGL